MFKIFLGAIIGAIAMLVALIYVGWKESQKEETEKINSAKKLSDLNDDELKFVALAFIHELTEEIEKREKNKRGEIRNENEPFEEFNGKE
jgi:FtsZ-interacting cell division protein ZipA